MDTQRPVLAVLMGDAPPPQMETIERRAEVRYATADNLAEALDGADALYLWDFSASALRGAWDRAASLRWVHAGFAGVDGVLFEELRESDVVLTNSRGVFDRPMAEYVLAYILAFAKEIPAFARSQAAHSWDRLETTQIRGASVLVVGTGAIGRETARLLRAVGMEVAGVGRTARSDEDFGTVHAASDLADVVGGYDYVVDIAPLTRETAGLFDAAVFARMKTGARFVNVGRGATVDTDALVGALASGRLAGAALDVFHAEPLPGDHPLWDMENVLMTPHISGDGRGTTAELAEIFRANFDRFAAGSPLENVVDKHLGFVPA